MLPQLFFDHTTYGMVWYGIPSKWMDLCVHAHTRRLLHFQNVFNYYFCCHCWCRCRLPLPLALMLLLLLTPLNIAEARTTTWAQANNLQLENVWPIEWPPERQLKTVYMWECVRVCGSVCVCVINDVQAERHTYRHTNNGLPINHFNNKTWESARNAFGCAPYVLHFTSFLRYFAFLFVSFLVHFAFHIEYTNILFALSAKCLSKYHEKYSKL